MPAKLLLLLTALFLLLVACVPVETEEFDENRVTPITPPTRLARPSVVATAETPEAVQTPVASAGCSVASVPSTPTGSATPEPAGGERIVSPRGVPPPQSVMPIVPRPDFELEGQLRQLLGTSSDGYGVAAIDLRSGRSVSINGGQVFYSASIFKTWVMYEVYHQASLGLLRLDQGLVMTPYYDAFGLGPRATTLCQHLTVQEALEAMMSISDNSAAVLLQDLVGAPNINTSLEVLGLKDSRLTTEDLTLTADDMGLLLQLIGSGKAVSREASEAMGALMASETFNNGLATGIPSDALLAHKTGNWPNARHDVGIVFAPETTYVVAILSDNRSGSQEMIAALSAAIYASFNP